jgi:hypothetical protein
LVAISLIPFLNEGRSSWWPPTWFPFNMKGQTT